MSNIAWWGVIKSGWPVLSVLLLMSVFTVSIFLEKWKTFGKITENSDPFLDSVRKLNDAQKTIAWCERSTQPLAYITQSIFKSSGKREDKEKTLQRAIQVVVFKLETKISALGTVASIAPFVGLLGTVIGIIRSFRAVSMSGQGGASLVAIGIAEALIGTAAGLVVAIPSLLAYNYFANKMRRLIQGWEIAGQEVIDISLGGRGA